MEDQTFRGKDYTKTTFAGQQFAHCTFKECLFIESKLSNAQFAFCTFENCNLSLVNTEMCRFQETAFIESKIVGAKFHLCEKRFFSIRAQNCVLISCNFSDLKMKKVKFSDSQVTDCDFKETDLLEADFSGCDLKGTLFHHCNLAKADFREAQNYEIDPQTNKIAKAQFSLPDALSLLKGFNIEIS